MYSRCIYTCPYYCSRDKLWLRCEGGELRFHDGESTSDYVARHCSAESWKTCSIAASLNRYYERQEKEDEEARRDQAVKA